MRFIAFYIFYFLLTALVAWMISFQLSYGYIKQPMSRYIKKHEAELRDKLFGRLYSEADKCNLLDDYELMQQCRKNISHQLAVLVIEEEFVDWPHDLFFVKQVNNRYFQLGWNGALVEITNETNKSLLVSSFVPYIFNLITRNCNFFNHAGIPAASCEVLSSLPLDINNKGYMIRLLPLTEDTNYFLYLILFPISTILFLINFDLSYAPQFSIGFITLILPAILSFITVKWYKKVSKI